MKKRFNNIVKKILHGKGKRNIHLRNKKDKVIAIKVFSENKKE